MKGRLEDMAVADIIQYNCQDRKSARVEIKQGLQRASLFFKNGNLVHATLGDLKGEEAVFNLLGWEKGGFDQQTEEEPPDVSITRSWSTLLLEGAQRLDEEQGDQNEELSDASSAATKTARAKETIWDMLNEFTEKIDGVWGFVVANSDGEIILRSISNINKPEAVISQANQLFKTIGRASAKVGAGKLEDCVLTTDDAFLFIRPLESQNHFLLVVADNKRTGLGNLRHLMKVHAKRLSTLDFELLRVFMGEGEWEDDRRS